MWIQALPPDSWSLWESVSSLKRETEYHPPPAELANGYGMREASAIVLRVLSVGDRSPPLLLCCTCPSWALLCPMPCPIGAPSGALCPVQ